MKTMRFTQSMNVYRCGDVAVFDHIPAADAVDAKFRSCQCPLLAKPGPIDQTAENGSFRWERTFQGELRIRVEVTQFGHRQQRHFSSASKVEKWLPIHGAA